MKTKPFSVIILLLVLFLLSAVASAQETKSGEHAAETMKVYYMAFLKSGSERGQDSATVAAIQQGHMAHINRMAEDKKLVLAGPFIGDKEFRGIFVLNVGSMEEAQELTEQDPAVKSGRLSVEIIRWYGPVKLSEIEW
jgi:uncharacterized protein YciI